MSLRRIVESIETPLAGAASLLVSPAALAARLYVGWVFVHSGMLKLMDWGQTVSLFQSEYRVPVLPPMIAAVAGTGGELVFGSLLLLGLFGRASALGLFAVNAMAVISYRHVLLGDGFEAALAQHVLWATLIAALFVHGPGRWSVDGFAFGVGGRMPDTARAPA